MLFHVFPQASGAFGLVMDGIKASPVVCQGSQPFGPFLEITAVRSEHVISEIDGRNPRELLLPLLHGPSVPGSGHSMAGIFVDPKPDGPHGAPFLGIKRHKSHTICYIIMPYQNSIQLTKGIQWDCIAESWTHSHLAAAALDGRPNCLVRPMHAFTQEGHLILCRPEELIYSTKDSMLRDMKYRTIDYMSEA